MSYDESLAMRLEKLVKRRKGFAQKRMFGGVGFLLNGNMCFGVHKDYLVLRLGETAAAAALKEKNTKPFDITGRAMRGWVMFESKETQNETALKNWIEVAVRFVWTLQPKT